MHLVKLGNFSPLCLTINSHKVQAFCYNVCIIFMWVFFVNFTVLYFFYTYVLELNVAWLSFFIYQCCNKRLGTETRQVRRA